MVAEIDEQLPVLAESLIEPGAVIFVKFPERGI